MNQKTCIRIFADIIQIKECRKKIRENEKIFHYIANIFSLAGNDVRLKILFLLNEEKKLCPCDMADILNMKVAAISQHLRKLKDGNLIVATREGQTIYYSLSKQGTKVFKLVNIKRIQNIK